ncbi:MAG: hypothetical protein AAGI08_08905 [Bacteroidota bacterium]
MRYLPVLLLLLAGCDAADPDAAAWVSPSVQVELVYPKTPALAKSQALWTVTLTVTSPSGDDFSPNPVTIDDAQTNQAVFDVSVPADSAYTFAVRYEREGALAAEGAALYFVDSGVGDLTIPAIVRDGSVGAFALVPSVVRVPAGTPIELGVRYYGDGAPAAGVAAQLNVNGTSPAGLDITGPDLVLPTGNEVSLAWRFEPAEPGIRALGRITATAGTEDFCLDIPTAGARRVTTEGAIAALAAVGACVESAN